jgi:hypothetical protein
MSSIFDLFNEDDEPAEGQGDQLLDSPNLGSILDDVIKSRPVAGRPAGFDPDAPAVPQSDGEPQGTEGGAAAPASSPSGAPASAPPESPPAAAVAPPSPPSPPADPFAGLTELERLELLQYRQALADPERALAVKRAVLGVPESPPAVVSEPVSSPPPPALPEEIEPGSWEAQMWQQNQDMRRELEALKAGQQQTQAQTEQEAKNAAAIRSTNAFAQRYVGKLTKEEIEAICQTAGMQKLPDTFRPTTKTWDEAMDKSLEFTLRSNDALLAKVLGVAPAAPPPATGAETPEANQRKRALTALSSAASPSGDTPQRTPIEHRGDGKLTEKSRLQLVQEMMGGGLRGSPGEGI